MSYFNTAADFIQKEEGFRTTAYWDVNAYRIGFGSDTITMPNGSFRKVVKGDKITKEMAVADLTRRMRDEFEPKVKKQIGEPYYSNLPDSAKVSLLSLAYNYGSITKKAIIDAARTGNPQLLAKAIVDSTYDDNKKLSESQRTALRNRRAKEANFIVAGMAAVTKAVTSGAKAATEEVKKNPIRVILITTGAVIGVYLIIKALKKGN